MSHLVAYIEDDELIAEFIDKFNIQGTGWMGRAKQWIPTIADRIGSSNFYQYQYCNVEIKDYKAALPCEAKYLRAIYNGAFKLNLNNSIHQINKGQCVYNYDSRNVTINRKFVTTSFEEGTLTFYYWGIPVDEAGHVWVPDDEYFKDAIKWGMFSYLLLRGYKHPIFNWEMANQQFETFIPRARNSVGRMSMMKWEQFKEKNDLFTFDDHNFTEVYHNTL